MFLGLNTYAQKDFDLSKLQVDMTNPDVKAKYEKLKAEGFDFSNVPQKKPMNETGLDGVVNMFRENQKNLKEATRILSFEERIPSLGKAEVERQIAAIQEKMSEASGADKTQMQDLINKLNGRLSQLK